MGADDQNVEVGNRGAGSGRPPATMRAVVLDAPGPPSALAIRELPVPVPSAGQVLIRVRAFGLNRLELYLRLGLSQGVTFPRVPGVEATGVVEQCPGGEFRAGQQVAALMGGMGRVFDGGYLDAVAAGTAAVPIGRVYRFDQIVEAHADMEQNRVSGKLVVTT
jgi:NADPH:quinone reductase